MSKVDAPKNLLEIISTKCGYIHDIHEMRIISTKHRDPKMRRISMERGDTRNVDIHNQNKINALRCWTPTHEVNKNTKTAKGLRANE